MLAFIIRMGILLALSPAQAATSNRVASISISQDFINEQLKLQMSKAEMIRDLKVELHPEREQILLLGEAQVPVEELRAINLDPSLGRYRFQLAAKLATTPQGHLIIEFPLNETFFYPSDSKNPRAERVILPVQMLSIALASARGYLAALSGDFEGFDRRTRKVEALLKAVEVSIAREKNADALEDLRTQRDSLKIQLAAIPIERKQLQNMSKSLAATLGFAGEKEINLNEDLAAAKNALILKVKLSQLAPYLKGVDLGGVRLRNDKKDGGGQNYLTIDVNSELAEEAPAPSAPPRPGERVPLKTPPAIVVRLQQALFDSQAVVSAEKTKMGSSLRDFALEMMDDGLHVTGRWKTFFIFSIPFKTVVDFVTTGVDEFDVRVRDIKVGGVDVDFLSKFILDSVRKRLDSSLKGICTFDEVRKLEDGSQALRVHVDSKHLVPAFPDLHLVNVDVRSQVFLLKVGKL